MTNEGPWQIVYQHGGAGERYTASSAAEVLGVRTHTVIAWIKRGWLVASWSIARCCYIIRRRSLRRLLCDYPSVARTVMEAQARKYRR